MEGALTVDRTEWLQLIPELTWVSFASAINITQNYFSAASPSILRDSHPGPGGAWHSCLQPVENTIFIFYFVTFRAIRFKTDIAVSGKTFLYYFQNFKDQRMRQTYQECGYLSLEIYVYAQFNDKYLQYARLNKFTMQEEAESFLFESSTQIIFKQYSMKLIYTSYEYLKLQTY